MIVVVTSQFASGISDIVDVTVNGDSFAFAGEAWGKPVVVNGLSEASALAYGVLQGGMSLRGEDALMSHLRDGVAEILPDSETEPPKPTGFGERGELAGIVWKAAKDSGEQISAIAAEYVADALLSRGWSPE